jgi:tetratricopeptide (TPR) repeat protein
MRIALSFVLVLLLMVRAAADPLPADDLATCRNRQAEAGARLAACETLLADGTLTGKDLANALDLRGSAEFAKRHYDKAIAAFTDAIAADPENAGIINRRGLAYQHKGQDDLALADYNLALQKRPTFGAPYNNRGTMQLRHGALQSALDDFNAAIRFGSTPQVAHANRGYVRTLMKDYEDALADFAEAEKADAEFPLIGYHRCETLTAMGKFDDAIASCNAVLARQPKHQVALCARAEANLGKGDLDAALADLNAVLAVNPNNVRAHADRGRLFEAKGDLAQARADDRSAAFALTRFDELDVAMARKQAQERLAALTPQSPDTAASRVALVIGNGAYRNVHPLPNPPRDARLIADTLRGIGFQTVTLTTDLTRDKFFEALRDFASEGEKADWAVVYYAGHGFEIGGINYLVPVDARLAADRDAETEAVALEQVLAAARASCGWSFSMPAATTRSRRP